MSKILGGLVQTSENWLTRTAAGLTHGTDVANAADKGDYGRLLNLGVSSGDAEKMAKKGDARANDEGFALTKWLDL